MRTKTILTFFLALCLISAPPSGHSQSSSSFKTPLSQDILNILVNEISGQIIFNNEVILAGAPWIRNAAEFANTLYESEKMVDIAKSYGIETIRIDQFTRDREFSYAFEGEFWIVKPEKKTCRPPGGRCRPCCQRVFICGYHWRSYLYSTSPGK